MIFGIKKKPIQTREELKLTAGDVEKMGVRINWDKLRKTVGVCDAQMRDGRINSECKKMFEDLKIEVVDE